MPSRAERACSSAARSSGRSVVRSPGASGGKDHGGQILGADPAALRGSGGFGADDLATAHVAGQLSRHPSVLARDALEVNELVVERQSPRIDHLWEAAQAGCRLGLLVSRRCGCV